MYRDEENLYHYTYRKDGSEDGQIQETVTTASASGVSSADSGPQGPVQEMKPVK